MPEHTNSTPLITITLGMGRDRPQGRHVDLKADLLASLARTLREHAGVDAWWSASTFDGNYRSGKRWKSAAAIALDVDYYDDHGKHAHLPDDVARQAIKSLSNLANLLHLTPRGLRIVLVADQPITDKEQFRRAARGAAQLVRRRLGPLMSERKGLVVDPTVTGDFARFLFTPCATVEGVRRKARVDIARSELWRVGELTEHDPEDLERGVRNAHRREGEWDKVREQILRRLSIRNPLTQLGATINGHENFRCPLHPPDDVPSAWIWTAPNGAELFVCAHGRRGIEVGVETRGGKFLADAVALEAFLRKLPLGKATAELARELSIAVPGSSPHNKPSASVVKVIELPRPVAPILPREAYDLAPGSFRSIVRFFGDRTEAPEPFLLYAIATWAGAMFGRAVHNRYASLIYPLVYLILVAPAGRRKTSSDSFVRRALLPDEWATDAFGFLEHRGTIGSGPALLQILAWVEDKLGKGAVTLWHAPEWSAVLRAAERDGGKDLVPHLLAAYDGLRNYDHHVRGTGTRSPGPIHLDRPGLAIISTAQETMLRAHLSSDAVGLGLAARLNMIYHGSSAEAVPRPELAFKSANWSGVHDAASAIRNAAIEWRREAKDKPDGIEIAIAEGSDAERAWTNWYLKRHEKEQSVEGHEFDRAAELTARVPEHARRYALIRAAVEGRREISLDDMTWGITMAEYAGDCAVYLATGGGVGETHGDARTRALLGVIHKAGGNWVRLRDMYRNTRAASNAYETRRLLEALNSQGAIELDLQRPAKARCTCPDCDREGGTK